MHTYGATEYLSSSKLFKLLTSLFFSLNSNHHKRDRRELFSNTGSDIVRKIVSLYQEEMYFDRVLKSQFDVLYRDLV